MPTSVKVKLFERKTIVSENQSNPGLQDSMHMIICSPDFELEYGV